MIHYLKNKEYKMSFLNKDLSEETRSEVAKISEKVLEDIIRSGVIEDFIKDLYDKIQKTIEAHLAVDTQVNLCRKISEEVDRVIKKLLIGDIEILKTLNLDTEYTFDSLDLIRLKIFEKFGDSISKTVVKDLQGKIGHLEKELKQYRTRGE